MTADDGHGDGDTGAGVTRRRRFRAVIFLALFSVAFTAILIGIDGAGQPAGGPAEGPNLIAGAQQSGAGVDSGEASPAPTERPGDPQGLQSATALDFSQLHPLAPAGDGVGGGATEPAAAPVGLGIPSLDVGGASVVPIGVDDAGALDVPGPTEVGWYRFGAAPDGPGSTVLAAHIAYDGIDGVFRRLSSIKAGAQIVVILDDGRTQAYAVSEVTVYTKSALPVADLFAESGPQRLVLITCGGRFNPNLGHYESNIVVTATPSAQAGRGD